MDEKHWKKMFALIEKGEGNTFIQFILDAGLDVNTFKNKNGTTMLSYAVECGNLEIIEFLIQNGADANVRNSDGSQSVHIAAKYGRKDIVEFFLNIGISIDSCDSDKCTPLHYAAAAGERDISLASWDSYQELMQFLVASNANVNAMNRNDCTPLLLAARFRCKHTVELLIKLGANVECCDNNQWTVLHHSSINGWSGIVQTLMEGGFHIDLNAKNSEGDTALIMAAACSHEEVVKLLIESGADAECQIYNGRTLLHQACRQGWLNVVKSLVAKGSDLNAKNSRGGTPLLMAAFSSQARVVEYLIEIGADVNCCYFDGKTVLHYACTQGWLDIVKSLIKKKVDLNTQSNNCNTPLHFAVLGRNLKIVEHLLKAGADCCVKNVQGNTALNSLIRRHPCLEDIILFLENGAYFQPQDYFVMSDTSYLREGILQDVQLCTQAIMNQFNNVDLPKVYNIPVLFEHLPSIENLKLVNNANVTRDIARNVEHEIQTKGYCNVLNVHPGALSILSVRALVAYYELSV